MKQRNLYMIGGLLLVIGIFLPQISYLFATVIYDVTAPTFNNVWPPGSLSQPTPLTPGGLYELTASVSDNVNDNFDIGVQTTVEAYDPDGAFQPMGPKILTPVEDEYGYYKYHHWYDWQCPSAPACVIRFTWTAVDKAGNKKTIYTYGVTGSPTGEFYINNQKVTDDLVLYIREPELSLAVKITSLPAYVKDVKIQVSGAASATLSYSGGQLTKGTATDGSDLYSGSYTLPKEGVYTITASLQDTSSNWYTLSIINLPWGEIPPPPPSGLQILLCLAGLGAVVYGWRRGE